VYAVHVVWKLLQFFLSGYECVINIMESVERLGDYPVEYCVLSTFNNEVVSHRG
jgi:hypothetical protein